MTRRPRFLGAAAGALCALTLSLFSLVALAEGAAPSVTPPSVAGNFPKKLAITVVADERLLSTLEQRVSSWFSDGTEVRAWIVPLSEQRALLTFSSVSPPAPARHLVREVRLRQGFDELGLERLASVTHSAFVALSEGVEGVAREQAERELDAAGVTVRTSAPPIAVPALAAPVAAPPPVAKAPPAPRAKAPSVSLLIAAGYGVRFRGDEGTANGPSLAFGVQLPSGRSAFDLQLSAQYLFRTEFQADPFLASLQTTALRAHFGVEPRLSSSFYGQALLGLGADLARISASASGSNSEQTLLVPHASGTQWRGAGELTLGIVRCGARLDVGVYAHANFMFEDVHYSLTNGSDDTLLARPWRVQPALSIQGRFRGAL